MKVNTRVTSTTGKSATHGATGNARARHPVAERRDAESDRRPTKPPGRAKEAENTREPATAERDRGLQGVSVEQC